MAESQSRSRSHPHRGSKQPSGVGERELSVAQIRQGPAKLGNHSFVENYMQAA